MTMSPRARPAIAVAALLLVGLLAGCDDEEDPPKPTESVSEPTSAPTSVTTEPTPTEPVEPTLPTEARTETRAGAEAFAEFYWEAVNAAQASGNTELLATLSVDTCTGCNGGIDAIARVYERGGRILGGQNTVVSSTLLRKPSGGWSATQVIRVSQQRIRGAGDLDQVSKAGRVDVVLGLTYDVDQWVVSFLEV